MITWKNVITKHHITPKCSSMSSTPPHPLMTPGGAFHFKKLSLSPSGVVVHHWIPVPNAIPRPVKNSYMLTSLELPPHLKQQAKLIPQTIISPCSTKA
mmetsp:Transcript_41781/g.73379  ORF Transcript_41781/g.73379 Transcript_41781/m.73379 type:complete len:98 (-) Transcript_41781:5-298(-)